MSPDTQTATKPAMGATKVIDGGTATELFFADGQPSVLVIRGGSERVMARTLDDFPCRIEDDAT